MWDTASVLLQLVSQFTKESQGQFNLHLSPGHPRLIPYSLAKGVRFKVMTTMEPNIQPDVWV